MSDAADRAMEAIERAMEAAGEMWAQATEQSGKTGFGRCRTCKHWQRLTKSMTALERQLGGGDCTRGKTHEDHYDELDAIVYPYLEGAKFWWTGPEYGCVHWEYGGKK